MGAREKAILTKRALEMRKQRKLQLANQVQQYICGSTLRNSAKDNYGKRPRKQI